jgi:hypothetical protein
MLKPASQVGMGPQHAACPEMTHLVNSVQIPQTLKSLRCDNSSTQNKLHHPQQPHNNFNNTTKPPQPQEPPILNNNNNNNNNDNKLHFVWVRSCFVSPHCDHIATAPSLEIHWGLTFFWPGRENKATKS